MPFGLTNVPATFQSVMNQIFASLLRKGVLVFMDDILIYSSTLEEHIQLLQQVFQILRQHKFYVKLSKCTFAQSAVEYLGHTISAEGVSTEPTKVQAVKQWPKPKNLKDLRGFLGLTGYYRRFIRHYGLISRPLSDLLKKGVPFTWTSVTETAFQQLKKALIEAPVLALPNFHKSFVLETDASDTGFGAVLMQENHPIAYLSKAVCVKNQALSTYEKECWAIILAVEKWRQYLQHQEFVIKTYHKSLLHLKEQRITNKIQQKAVFKLMDLQFRIVYKQGTTNVAADALSRCLEPESVCPVSTVYFEWLDKIKQGYEDDPQAIKLLHDYNSSEPLGNGFSVSDGLIRQHGRLWLGVNRLAQRHIIQAVHSSGVGGHSGFLPTYQRIKQLFIWPKMKEDIQNYIRECTVCQQAKVEHTKVPGLLQPLPIPDQAWKVICMDFIEGLPRSQRFDTILVVIDKFTKYAHFIPLSHPFTALNVAQAFIDTVYKLHGLPDSIVSDRDKIFTSHLWKELFRLSDTHLLMSSSYHPQTDGQSERLNQCLETFLRCSVNACPRQWSKWLALAELWYNTSWHSSLGRSPFEALYGYAPRQLGLSSEAFIHSPDLEQWMLERNLLNDLLKHHLHRAQTRMKHQADKKRCEKQFAVDDLVYLKLQPYIQSLVAPRGNQKLSYKFFGPFKILAKVGAVAYKLDLPEDARIHPVVHVSQLKKHVSPTTRIESDISQVPDDPQTTVHPVSFLACRRLQKGSSSLFQIQVQWSSMPETLTTWEEINDLRRRCPGNPAWGQAGFQEQANVRRKRTRTVACPATEQTEGIGKL
jgi:hypothetical protein